MVTIPDVAIAILKCTKARFLFDLFPDVETPHWSLVLDRRILIYKDSAQKFTRTQPLRKGRKYTDSTQ